MARDILAVALDLEGTLVDVESAHHQAHLAAAADVGLHLKLEQAYQQIAHFIGGPDLKVAEDIYALAGKPTTCSPQSILAAKQGYYEQNLRTMDIRPRPGVCDAIVFLQSRGMRVAIGSLTPTAQAQVLIHRSQLERLIDPHHIVLAEHVQNHKPAPDVFQETARRMGVHPVAQVVFEDSPRGVQAARAAGSLAVGMPVVLQPFVDTVAPLMQAGAYWVYRDWREINLHELILNLCSL